MPAPTPIDIFCEEHWNETSEEEFRVCFASKLGERIEGMLESGNYDMTIDMIIDDVLENARHEIGDLITEHFNSAFEE